MTTLIVPCAGRSTRFRGMRPKWLLTYPTGELMIQKAVQSMYLDRYDKIVFVIVQEHSNDYSAELILRQAFSSRIEQVQVVVLDEFTNGPAETVVKAIEKENIRGSVVVKDCDNSVTFDFPEDLSNFVVGSHLEQIPDVSNVAGKSFLSVNEQGLIVDIIEKKIVSDIISLGVYGFSDADLISTVLDSILNDSRASGEIYMSHIISALLHKKYSQYFFVQANTYEDWGTLYDWNRTRNQFRTIFCDIDGVIYKNRGRYGALTWDDDPEIIAENVEILKGLVSYGAQLVLTTSRPDEFKQKIAAEMMQIGLEYHEIILGLNHSSRIIINDFAPTNPYPSCTAINVNRDGMLESYLDI